MNPHDSHHLEALLEVGDYARLAELLRNAHRHGDTELLERLTEAIYSWLRARWFERPLPRLGKLMEQLAVRRETPSARAARLVEGQYLDETVWMPLLDDPRDLGAALELLTRARSGDVGGRLTALHRRVGTTRDPVLTSTFLRWIEAPPLRATSTQPMWNEVFELLQEQGDPRTFEALQHLATVKFPAGNSMQTWMGEKLAREVDRWSRRPDINTLRALLTSSAEGDLQSTLDRLAESIASLTGSELVGSGGETVTRDLNLLLAARDVVTARWSEADEPILSNLCLPFSRKVFLWADARLERLLIANVNNGWEARESRRTGGLAAPVLEPTVVLGELLVLDPEGVLLWQENLHEGVLGCALSPCGRWVATLTWEHVLVLRDLEKQRSTRVKLLDEKPNEAVRHRVSNGQMLAFGAGPEVYSAHGVEHLSGTSVHGRDLWVLRTRFDEETLSALSITEVVRVEGFRVAPLDPVTVRTQPAYQGRAAIALSPDRRWLFLDGSTLEHAPSTRQMLFELDGTEARLVQAFRWEPSAEFRFDDQNRLVAWENAYEGWDYKTQKRHTVPPKKTTLEPRHVLPVSVEEQANPWLPSHFDEARWVAPSVSALDVAQSGRLAAGVVVDHDSIVRVWSAAGELELELKEDNLIQALALSPDGNELAIACTLNIQLVDLTSTAKNARNKKPKPKRLKGHKDTPWALEWSHNKLISCAQDAVLVWVDDEVKLDLRAGTRPRCLAVHAGGELLACATEEALTLWDLTDGSELARTPLTTPTTDLAWSLDGAEVVYTAGTKLRTWSPSSSRDEVRWSNEFALDSLRANPSLGLLIANDRRGNLWQLHAKTGDWEAALLVALHATGPLRIGPSGQILVGAGCVGRRGSLSLLSPAVGSAKGGR